MFNHICMFKSRAEALVALAQYTNGEGQFDASRVVAGQRLVMRRAVFASDDEGNVVEAAPEVVHPGYFVTVTLADIDFDIVDLRDNACRLVNDGETGAKPYVAPDLDLSQFAGAILEPVPAGTVFFN